MTKIHKLNIVLLMLFAVSQNSWAEQKSQFQIELENSISNKIDIDLSEWTTGKYPKLLFSVDNSGQITRLETKDGSRDYNARICKTTLKAMQPLSREFQNSDLEIECRPAIELSKTVLKQNIKYQKQYLTEVQKQIFAKANQEEFKTLKANQLGLQVKVNSSGDLISAETLCSSGFENIDKAFLQATKDIGTFPKPELEKFRKNTASLPAEIPLDLYFQVGKGYKSHNGTNTAEAINLGTQLGSIGVTLASIVGNILLLAR